MKITVVMAAYNAEKYLMEAVNSILEQSYRKFEFIIVNDGSSDSTAELLSSIQDSRVKVIHLKKNRGLAASLNKGIKESKGDWIVRQDADDISLPNRLEEQVKYVKTNPGVIMVSSLIQCINGRYKFSERELKREEEHFNVPLTTEHLENNRFRCFHICHGTVMFSKKAFLKAGRYNSKIRLIEDFDLWSRMLPIGRIKKVPKVLYQYRMDPHSLQRRDMAKTFNQINIVLSTYIQRYCYSHLNKKPRFLVFGTKSSCKNYKKNVVPKTKFIVKEYIDRADKDSLVRAFKAVSGKKIEGIIVLDGPDCKRSMEYLQSNGLILNQNLFNPLNMQGN